MKNSLENLQNLQQKISAYIDKKTIRENNSLKIDIYIYVHLHCKKNLFTNDINIKQLLGFGGFVSTNNFVDNGTNSSLLTNFSSNLS